jgi:hypothetical protein
VCDAVDRVWWDTAMHMRRTLLAVAVAAMAAVAILALVAAPNGGAGHSMARVHWNGSSWFLTGASYPGINRACDVGCRGQGGFVEHKRTVDRAFKRMARHGVRVVRWYVLADDAWQVKRDATGMPTGLATTKMYPDLDVALNAARRYDLYLHLVLLGDVSQVPATWVTDPSQRDALADVLGLMFERYSDTRHVLTWEIADTPERAIDAGLLPLADMQALTERLAAEVHDRSRAKVTLTSSSLDRVGSWSRLGLDYLGAQSWSTQTGTACAHCTTAAAVRAATGAIEPIAITATDLPASGAHDRLERLRARGYAGALAWSLLPTEHPGNPGATPSLPLDAIWRFTYATSDAGPRNKPLNPCLGPKAGTFWCPNLKMSPPANLFAGKRHGDTVLFSRNSINSVGLGPASLYGTRSGEFTMRAAQVLHRRNGRPIRIQTGARLLFKAIPGQYRYWKWNGAATFELWQLDGAGNPVRLMRTGPKTVYCLRDLRRTHGHLKRSPKRYVYPACSQKLGQRRVTLGTSVGWSDIYPSTYHENWIDVGGLKGCFSYVHIADPDDVMYESNEDDNRSQVVVRLPFKGNAKGCPRAKRIPTVADASY